MTARGTRPDVTHRSSPRSAVADQPAVWIGSSVIFTWNAVLAFAAGRWWVGILGTVTAVLALVAATSSVRSRRATSSRRPG